MSQVHFSMLLFNCRYSLCFFLITKCRYVLAPFLDTFCLLVTQWLSSHLWTSVFENLFLLKILQILNKRPFLDKICGSYSSTFSSLRHVLLRNFFFNVCVTTNKCVLSFFLFHGVISSQGRAAATPWPSRGQEATHALSERAVSITSHSLWIGDGFRELLWR